MSNRSWRAALVVALGIVAGCAPSAPSASVAPTAAPSPPVAATVASAPSIVPPPAASAAASPATSPVVAAQKPAAPSPTGPIETLSMGYSNISADDLAAYFAVDTGLFERNRLKVDAQLIAGGASTTAALLSGQIQVSQAGGSETLSAVANGADLVIVAVASGVYPYLFEVIPEITTFQDLAGKKLGVSNIGGSADIATRVVLRQNGLDPDKDVTIVATGSAANRTSALSSGAIQGGMAAPPDTLTLEALGLHPLIDLATQHLPAANTVISVQRSYLNANRPVVQRYVDAIVQASVQMKRDQPATMTVLKHYLGSDDDAAMSATYDFFVKEIIEPLPYPRPEHFKDAIDALAPTNPKVRDVDLNKMLDASLVQSAAERGLDR